MDKDSFTTDNVVQFTQGSSPKARPNQNFLAKIIAKIITQQKDLWFESMPLGSSEDL